MPSSSSASPRCSAAGRSRPISSHVRAVAAGCAAVLLCCLLSGVAEAGEFKYWSYWRASGDTWTYATSGPAGHRPKDGAVDGWRFTAGRERDAAQPRTAPDFDRICAGIRIKDGYKRIALVVDYGTSADAPEGDRPPKSKPDTSCVVVPVAATSADVLEEKRRTRLDTSGLLCAIDGYPAKGCRDAAEQTTAASPSTAATPDGGSTGRTTTYVALGAGAVIALLLVAAMAARRRSENG